MKAAMQTLDKALSWDFLTGFAVVTMVAVAYAGNVAATVLCGLVGVLCNELRKEANEQR